MSELNEQVVREALHHVYDPEIGVNIVDLGMVREVNIIDGRVTIHLVLTTPGCPLAGFILYRVRETVQALDGVSDVEVNVLDEPWQPPASEEWDQWVNGALGGRGW